MFKLARILFHVKQSSQLVTYASNSFVLVPFLGSGVNYREPKRCWNNYSLLSAYLAQKRP